jgi:hypothetical protein
MSSNPRTTKNKQTNKQKNPTKPNGREFPKSWERDGNPSQEAF